MRETKTASELHEMIMQEVRKHPDWKHIEGVTILPEMQTNSHLTNWKPAFVASGPSIAPAAAFQYANLLASKFDLV